MHLPQFEYRRKMFTQLNINNVGPAFSYEQVNEVSGLNQFNSPSTKLSSPLTIITSPRSQINHLNWLNSLEITSSHLTQELKSILFFDLLDQTPNIRQLFSIDYLNLVDNLIKINERQGLSIREEQTLTSNNYHPLMRQEYDKQILKEQIGHQLDTYNIIKSDKMNLSDYNCTNTPPLQSQLETNNYNHQHLQQTIPHQTQNQYSDTQTRNHRREYIPERYAKPYEDKKKPKSPSNISKQLIKAAIKALNNLSVKLGKLVQ